MGYIDDVINNVINKNPEEKEFHQTLVETIESIRPIVESKKIYQKLRILERITEPDRQIKFRVNWINSNNNVVVNNGYRVQFNNVLGPYKGGLRFHPSVNLGIFKFLSFEQTFKNALTGLPLGGAKGGSDFDPKMKTDFEIMSFCQNFMNELCKYVGAQIDIPAGDIGVGEKEIGFLYGQYKKIKNLHEGVITGKAIEFDGLFGRREATGFGLVYFIEEMLKANKNSLEDKRVCISGSGNVAIYTAKKSIDLGAKVITMSDSDGWIYDSEGIDLSIIKEIKEEKKLRISEYKKLKKGSKYYKGRFNWGIECDIAIPCATQNEILIDDAKNLVNNSCIAVCEGANMPTDLSATNFLMENGVLFAPAKAANAGGVSVSGIEMVQNAMKSKFEFEEVDSKLFSIMKGIFNNISNTSMEYGYKNNYVIGANIYAFKIISEAMIFHGI